MIGTARGEMRKLYKCRAKIPDVLASKCKYSTFYLCIQKLDVPVFEAINLVG